jgi:ATP-dependent protease HslVU (ClpYQ) peptidase subunit
LTVVVYRDGTMAADTRIVHSDAGIAKATKLVRKRIGRRDHILGFAGVVSYATMYIEWFGSGKPMPEQLRNIPSEYGFNVLILAGKRLYEADGVGRPIEVESKFYAIGSGAMAALGAMHHGATALQAAKIACKLDHNCGLPIQTMILPTRLRGVCV